MDKDRINMHIEIPVNTKAIVYLPSDDAKRIFLDNNPVSEYENIITKGVENGKVLLMIGSGSYNFVIKK